MNRSAWNALRRGDLVDVHLPSFPVGPVQRGEVVRVTVRARGTNDVAIVLHGPPRRVVTPPLTTVHPAAETDGCWRCAELALAASAT